MIPKIIHYCWFGDEDLPKEQEAFIIEWKTMHPEWDFFLWNSSNSPMHLPYLEKANKFKKWANMSNFIRFYSINEKGGIYLDTDIKLIKNLSSLIDNDCFFGFEEGSAKNTVFWVNSAICGSTMNNSFIKSCYNELLEKFDGIEESNLSGPRLLTQKLIDDKGLAEYKEQVLDGIHLYPVEYFYPIHYSEAYKVSELQKNIFPETVAVHVWARSWIDKSVLIESIDYLTFKSVSQEKYIGELKEIIKQQETNRDEIFYSKQHLEKELIKLNEEKKNITLIDEKVFIEIIQKLLTDALTKLENNINTVNDAVINLDNKSQIWDKSIAIFSTLLNEVLINQTKVEPVLDNLLLKLNDQEDKISRLYIQDKYIQEIQKIVSELNQLTDKEELKAQHLNAINKILLHQKQTNHIATKELEAEQNLHKTTLQKLKQIHTINESKNIDLLANKSIIDELNNKYLQCFEGWQQDHFEKNNLQEQLRQEIHTLKIKINSLKISSLLVSKLTGKKILE